MPKLNLKDDDLEGGAESQGSGNEPTLPPNLREIGPGNGKSSPILIALLVVLVVFVAVFALNFFHVIHLWGNKPPQVVEMLPEPPAASTDSLAGGSTTAGDARASSSSTPELTPTPNVTPGTTKGSSASLSTEKPRPNALPLGSGAYSVQVSSWLSMAKAKEESDRLSAAGYSAFVEESSGGVPKRHWVRVGRYTTMKEAQEAASRFSREMETDAFVVRTGQE